MLPSTFKMLPSTFIPVSYQNVARKVEHGRRTQTRVKEREEREKEEVERVDESKSMRQFVYAKFHLVNSR